MHPQIEPQKAAPGYGGGAPDPTGSANPVASDATLAEILVTLRKRKWIILLALLLGLGYGYYKAKKQPHIFSSFGLIEIRAGSSNQYRVSGSVLGNEGSNRIPTEVAILTSDTLMLSVAKELDLANNPAFGGGHGIRRDIRDPVISQGIIGALQGGLHVAGLPKTDIIRISFDSLDPKLSADVVNAVIRAYIEHTLSARGDSTQRISDWLSRRLTGLKQEVEASQTAALDAGKRAGILGFDAGHNQITLSLDDLTKASATAQLARILAESRYRALSSASPDSIDSMLETGPAGASQVSGLSGLRSQLATAKANYAQLMITLLPNHPQAKIARAQIEALQKAIDQEQNRLVDQAKQAFIAARANEDQTRATLEQQKSEAYKLRDDLVDYTLKEREFESNRTLYESLLHSIRTASVQSGLESQEIDIIDEAKPALYPTLESTSSLLTLYGAIALVAGVIVAFVLESLDTGLSSVAEIEAITGLASLALIPRARKPGAEGATLTPVQRNLAVLANPKSQFSESFRALRTSLLLSTAGHPPRTILLTSATPSEGKTTVSTNLACVLAQRDVRVLLIDADLRRPTVHHRFALNGRLGLTTVLTGACTVEEAIQHVPDVPNLDILASGPVPPFPTEMLGSSTMTELLEKLKRTYTHIVIDSPPLLSVTDGVVLAREADAAVLIVRHGKSSKHVVRRARDLLLRAGAPLTGIALNAVDLKSPEYYGYYGYSGYSYAGVDTSSWQSKSKDKDSDNAKGDRS